MKYIVIKPIASLKKDDILHRDNNGHFYFIEIDKNDHEHKRHLNKKVVNCLVPEYIKEYKDQTS